ALDRTNISAGPLWQVRISAGGHDPNTKAAIASSAYDGNTLYVGGSATTIGGQSCAGGLRAVNPATGAFLWEKCLNGVLLGAPIAVPGLVVAGDASGTLKVLDSVTGQVLFNYQDTATKGKFRGTPTISNGILYDGSWSGF